MRTHCCTVQYSISLNEHVPHINSYLTLLHACYCRVMKENMIFAVIWYGTLKPDMTLFLKPLSISLSKLFYTGKTYFINITMCMQLAGLTCVGVRITPPGEQPFVCCVALVGATCDLPAKAACCYEHGAVQRLLLGLWLLLTKGYIDTQHSYLQNYRLTLMSSRDQSQLWWKTNTRTHQQVYEYTPSLQLLQALLYVVATCIMYQCMLATCTLGVYTYIHYLQVCMALSTYMQVYGIKGPSWLSTVPKFDLVSGMSVDYTPWSMQTAYEIVAEINKP